MSLEVVTPQIYETIFTSKLKLYDKDLEVDEMDIDIITQNLETINKFHKETTKSAKHMQESINLAQEAIDNNDKKALNHIKNDMQALQDKIAKLENEVYIDSLTKVYNRKWLFNKVLESGNFQNEGVLVFIDLDDFKSINDNYGHLAGDKVLVLIANLLEKISNADIVRFGGDEFIIVSNENRVKSIETELDDINRSFEKKSLRFQEHTFKIGLSFGSAKYHKGDSFHQIAQIVDQKMYEQKRAKKMLTEEAV